jgi:peptidoglycan/xylan/chitin deacetylase (PgdA/CDA1 family)
MAQWMYAEFMRAWNSPTDGGGWIAGTTTDVTLTFDDGPHPTRTPKLLDTLAELNIKAAFFVLGEKLSASSTILKRMKDSGHQVGNHSFDHKDLSRLSEADIRAQLEKTQTLIGPLGTQKKYFRPPYGAQSAAVKKVAADGGWTTVLWNVDTEDWKLKSDKWVDHGFAQMKSGKSHIVLMHDIHQFTVDAVKPFVEKLKAGLKDVRFVPLG